MGCQESDYSTSPCPLEPLATVIRVGQHRTAARPFPSRAVAVEWKSTLQTLHASPEVLTLLSTYPLVSPHVSLDTTSLTMAREPPLDEIQWRSPKAQEMGGIHTNTGKSHPRCKLAQLAEALSQSCPTSPNPLSSMLPPITPP